MDQQPAIGQEWLSKHIFVDLQGVWFYLALLGVLVFCVLTFFLLNALPPPARRRLIVVCTFLGGLYYALEFFIPAEGVWLFGSLPVFRHNPLTGYIQPLATFLRALAGFAIGLGLISLFTVHGHRIARQRAGWGNSLAFFIAFFAIVIFGLWQHYQTAAMESRPAEPTFAMATYDILFNGMFNSLDATMFAILAFFIVSAAYRAFRIRSAEATLMMVSAFIVMLGQVPIGIVLTSWIPPDSPFALLRMERLANWILTGINAAAFRAIILGIMMGYLAMSLRVWLSLERGAYFEQA